MRFPRRPRYVPPRPASLELIGVLVLWSAVAALAASAPAALASDAPPDTLGFDLPGPAGTIAGWGGGPPETLHPDSTVVHGGHYSARIERTAEGTDDFSALSRSIPVTFGGDTLELRGWLRTEGVKGFAGLWLREDGPVGVVQFDNMQKWHLDGSRAWTEYRIALPLDRAARTILFGALLSGEGRVWVDDLRLLVNGQPLAAAPPMVRVATVVDTDHEFDAGSGIQAATPSPAQVDNLVLLGKVWGFLKYHHPRVTGAHLHWDYELFRVLPSVLGARDHAAATKALSDWVDRIGEPPPCHPCAKSPDHPQMSPRVEWISDRKLLGNDLSARLARIYTNRPAGGDEYYAALNEGVGNPDFHNEAPYPDRRYPDAGYRLLALCRFWNIIEYWYPDRDLIRERWDAVLAEFIPRLMVAGSEDEYKLAMMALIARIHDGHANLWNALQVRPPRGDCQLPVVTRFVEGKAVVTGYSNPTLGPATGLRIGDVIDSLDGRPVSALIAEWEPYYAASNQDARLRDMARALTQGPPGPCRVAGERGGADLGANAGRGGGRFDLTADRLSHKEIDAKAGLTHDLPGETFRLLADDVAYLKLSNVSAEKAGDYIRRAAGTRCLIIDIRNYPSEFVVFALGQHLIGRKTEFARFTYGDLANPGAFLWTEPIGLKPTEPRYEGSIAILVDEASQSQAEYTTMAFRSAPNALVVGSTTAGADGNISFIPLPGGLRAAISGIGVYYPDRRPTQQIGIVPDLVARPTIAGIRAGRDEVLEAAFRRVAGRDLTAPIR
jgi:hypothetical protein